MYDPSHGAPSAPDYAIKVNLFSLDTNDTEATMNNKKGPDSNTAGPLHDCVPAAGF